MKRKDVRSTTLTVAAIVAILFGALTVLSGGTALFGPAEARTALGDIVTFVLWFNFAAGFAYIAAGLGLFRRRKWALRLSVLIAVATALVFGAFGLHVLQGGPYEMRTVVAMTVRTAVWVAIAIVGYRSMPGEAPGA
jgi:hypothetical protein